MNRVIQSVGRLIRSETDTGVAVLVCQRFAQNQYSALFPSDWSQDENSSFDLQGLARGVGVVLAGKALLLREAIQYNDAA